MPVLELVEHAFNGIVVMGERVAHAVRQTGIVDQLAQALPRKLQVA